MLAGREVQKKPVYDSREVGVPPIRGLRRWGRESYGRIDFVDRVRVGASRHEIPMLALSTIALA